MKKITTMIMLLIAVSTFAQKNLFEALEFDGKEHKTIKMINGKEGFKIKAYTDYYPEKNTVVKNNYGKDVELTKRELKVDKIWYHHTDKIEHFAQPEKMRQPTSEFSENFVMIDGILYESSESDNDLTKYDVDYSFVWIPVKAKNEEVKNVKKKKVKFETDAVLKLVIVKTMIQK